MSSQNSFLQKGNEVVLNPGVNKVLLGESGQYLGVDTPDPTTVFQVDINDNTDKTGVFINATDTDASNTNNIFVIHNSTTRSGLLVRQLEDLAVAGAFQVIGQAGVVQTGTLLRVSHNEASSSGNCIYLLNNGTGTSLEVQHSSDSATPLVGLKINVANSGVGIPHSAIFETGRVAVGLSGASSLLHIKGEGNSSSTSSFRIDSSSIANLFVIRDDGALIQGEGSTTFYNSVSTNDATVTDLFLLSMSDGEVLTLESKVNGIKDDSSLAIGGTVFGVFRKSGGVIFQISTSDVVIKSSFATATFDLDTDGINVRIRATGQAATDISWSCLYNYYKSA